MKKWGRSAVDRSILVETTKSKPPAVAKFSRNSFSTARPRGRFGSSRVSHSTPPRIGSREAIVFASLIEAARFTKSYIKLISTSHLGRLKSGPILLKEYPFQPVGSIKIRGNERSMKAS